MNIYVGNLSSEVKDEDLNELFSQHGKVSSAKVIRDMFTQETRGFGFVEMPSQAEGMKAIETLNTFELKGKKIVVNEARPPRDKKGGGGGGRGAGGGGGGGRGGFGGGGGRGGRR
jgi:cold-inducible RNA-binding protein